LPRYDIRHRALEFPLIGAAVRGVAILGGIQQRPGQIRLPTCVVNIRCSLRFMASFRQMATRPRGADPR
jgi:hypothetical protein